jgi:hypothetical protein
MQHLEVSSAVRHIYDIRRQRDNIRRFETLCPFHLNRRIDMKCVKLAIYVVEAGTDRPSPLWGGGCR